jgi:hypothetical protein
VLALVDWAKRLDLDGSLAGELSPPGGLDDEHLRECITEEGWTLGATNLDSRAATRRGDATSRRSLTAVKEGTPIDDPRHYISALYRAGVISRDERDELMRLFS